MNLNYNPCKIKFSSSSSSSLSMPRVAATVCFDSRGWAFRQSGLGGVLCLGFLNLNRLLRTAWGTGGGAGGLDTTTGSICVYVYAIVSVVRK